MSETIRLLISDDHAIIREGLRALIDGDENIELVGEASDGVMAVDKAAALNPDVILMDLVMPRMDGVEAIIKIRENNPEARILVLSSFTDDERVIAAVKAGAVGFVLKDSDPIDLLKAIRAVHQGDSPFDPAISRKLLQAFNKSQKDEKHEIPLTKREIEVLKLLAIGTSTKLIAAELHISERTVSTHISNILMNLNLDNRIQATLYAIRNDLVDVEQ